MRVTPVGGASLSTHMLYMKDGSILTGLFCGCGGLFSAQGGRFFLVGPTVSISEAHCDIMDS